MPELTHRMKFRSLLDLGAKQQTSSLPKNDIVYQRNAVLTFKKPMKISKKQLLQMLAKKNSVIQGTFALQDSKILLITETKQVQKQSHPPSFRKKYIKTNFKRKQNQNAPQTSVREEMKGIQQKRQHINTGILRKYFAKNHLFNSESSSRDVNHLKGLKLVMNDTAYNQAESKDGQSCRQQRLDKRNRSIQFINNFMRTRYKTVHSGDKEIYQTYRQNQSAHSLMHIYRQSQRRDKSLYEPWQKKEEYDQFQF